MSLPVRLSAPVEHTPRGARNPTPGITPPTGAGRAKRIGDVIVELGFASRDAVDRAVAHAREQGRPTGQILLDEDFVTADQLARAVAERYGVDHIDLTLSHAAARLGPGA